MGDPRSALASAAGQRDEARHPKRSNTRQAAHHEHDRIGAGLAVDRDLRIFRGFLKFHRGRRVGKFQHHDLVAFERPLQHLRVLIGDQDPALNLRKTSKKRA
jgi:hypothetical protein